jgi:GNAT superfamily N-acetyltransferase
MSDASIRSARPEDVPTILELIRELADYEQALDKVHATESGLMEALFGDQPHAFAHVALVDGSDGEPQVVGLALWFLTFSTWVGRHGIWLEDLYVRPPWRGRGLGLGLLRELAAVCVQRGYGRLEWAVLDWNEPSRRFYESVGARELGDWIINRIDDDALPRLARGDGPAGR